MENKIYEYVCPDGNAPYSKWLNSLKDLKTRAIISSHIDRMELNNFGDSKFIGEGVIELRIHYGAGYRVYYARSGNNIYLLLCGGDKSSQSRDIELAKKYWRQYKVEVKNGKA